MKNFSVRIGSNHYQGDRVWVAGENLDRVINSLDSSFRPTTTTSGKNGTQYAMLLSKHDMDVTDTIKIYEDTVSRLERLFPGRVNKPSASTFQILQDYLGRDADLVAEAAEVARVIAAAEATPGFNDNPTLVQFIREQVAERTRRIGQERWRRELLREDGQACVVSGVKEALEASHLNYPRKSLSLRGVTLRVDLAHLFDYNGARLTPRNDGTIFWDYSGHEFHGKTLNLTPEKAKAVIAELGIHRPQVQELIAA